MMITVYKKKKNKRKRKKEEGRGGWRESEKNKR